MKSMGQIVASIHPDAWRPAGAGIAVSRTTDRETWRRVEIASGPRHDHLIRFRCRQAQQRDFAGGDRFFYKGHALVIVYVSQKFSPGLTFACVSANIPAPRLKSGPFLNFWHRIGQPFGFNLDRLSSSHRVP